MAVLVFAEQTDGGYKKAALEAVNYARKVAEQLSTEVVALTFGKADNAILGKHGADVVLTEGDQRLSNFDSGAWTKAIAKAAETHNASVIIFSHNTTGKGIASRVAARLKAGLVAGAIALPDTSKGFEVKKSVFSGKAFAYYKLDTPVKVISVTPNSIPVSEIPGKGELKDWSAGLADSDFKVKVRERKLAEGGVPLSEAELVVSGGRGLKGPENWGIVEDLAKALGAATACSRPVADSDWRPHHEHVGQTGGTIRPNLYIAIGISGAIQHLAGVNQSKTIVVINKDPEAPFFKAADYGIVGDAFEVVPKLTAAVKEFKANNA